MTAAVLITCGASEYFSQVIETWEQTVSGVQENQHEKEAAIAQVGELIKTLGWSIEQAQSYLKENYRVTGRKQLSLKQLHQLIEQLSQLMASKV